jgi:hypothetical protein
MLMRNSTALAYFTVEDERRRALGSSKSTFGYFEETRHAGSTRHDQSLSLVLDGPVLGWRMGATAGNRLRPGERPQDVLRNSRQR